MAQSKSFFNDVKEELECCVCQEQFSDVNEPKILKCLHTFCKNCLEKLLRQHGGAAITCPMCRQITECPNNNTSVLASNLFYKRMVQIVEAYSGQGDEGTPPCGNCEEHKPLKFHCFDCNYFLCEDCADGHKKFKVLSGHHVKEIGKFKSNDYEDFARKANVCKLHKEELRFYCGQCDICICRDCAILEHRDHKFVSFEEGIEEKKSEIGAKLKEVEENGSRLKNRKQLLEERRVKVNRSIDQATDEVHRVAEHRINLIRQHEARVTATLAERKSEVDDLFSNQLSSVTARLTEIDSSLKFTEEVFERNNLPEILNLEGTLEQRLLELAMPLGETPVANYCEVKYVPNNVFPSSDALGQLVTTNTEPSLSVAVGAGLKECLQGEESCFTVTTKDREGQTTYSENDKLVVVIKSKKSSKDIQPNITDLKNGRYTVSYRPEAVGEFEVSIKIRSQCIWGSPFQLKVTQRSKDLAGSGLSADAASTAPSKSKMKENVARFASPSPQFYVATPKFITFLFKAYGDDLKEMEKTYQVTLTRRDEGNGTYMYVIPGEACTVDEHEKACYSFVTLYERVHQNATLEQFSLKSDLKSLVYSLQEISEIGKKFPVLVEVSSDRKRWTLYGEKDVVEAALKDLEKKVGIKREDTASGNVKTVDQPSSAVVMKNRLETTIGKVKLSVLKGDITNEHVEVIVNAANDRLDHTGGVAKAIRDRGGWSIQDESNKIIKNKGRLRVGDAVATGAGYLQCKVVVHAVGPEWHKVGAVNSRKHLRRACLNSFRVAQEHEMTSVALPAIGSGIYGMPKDVCAEVMFDAVEEFVRLGNPKTKTITDIRFVNIDDATVEAFRNEFMKRYAANYLSDFVDSVKLIMRS